MKQGKKSEEDRIKDLLNSKFPEEVIDGLDLII